MASKFLKVDELQIEKDEASQLSEAITRVTDLYDIPLPSEKIMAWTMLSKTLVEVYGTRVAAIAMNKKPKLVTIDGSQPVATGGPILN